MKAAPRVACLLRLKIKGPGTDLYAEPVTCVGHVWIECSSRQEVDYTAGSKTSATPIHLKALGLVVTP